MADKELKKRKRDPSFNNTEKSKLLKLVSEHFNIIENKKTDGITVKKKTEEWQKIAKKFNASSLSYNRNHTTLKTLWENLKRKAKTVISSETQNRKGTGEGKSNKLVLDPLIYNVITLIQPHIKALKASNNEYDYNPNNDTKNNIPDRNKSEDDKDLCQLDQPISLLQPQDKEQLSGISATSKNQDWSYYNPNMLKAPVVIDFCEQNFAEEIEQPKNNISQNILIQERPEAENVILEFTEKMSNLNDKAQSDKKHSVQMQILHLQKLQEEEKLKQEKIKTEILKHQLQMYNE